MKDEDVLDEYIAKTTEQPEIEEKEPTEEEVVEQKAREGRPTAKSVLQKRTELNEVQLDKEMDSFLNKNAGKIDEQKFRSDIAQKLEEKGYISKADLATIEEKHLSDYESSQTQEQPVPVVSPPPLVANSLDVAKEQAGRAADWASSLKTPGGIGVLLMVLFFFIWIIVPVSNGKTRMQLLWGVLTGQVQFRSDIVSEEENAISAAVNSSQSASTNGTGSGGVSVLVPFAVDFGEDYGLG
jgi:hypothetical protein